MRTGVTLDILTYTVAAMTDKGARLKDRASGSTSAGYPTVVVNDESSAEVTTPNHEFSGDSVSVMLFWLFAMYVPAFKTSQVVKKMERGRRRGS